jgi:Protein of unknown function (DUF2911)
MRGTLLLTTSAAAVAAAALVVAPVSAQRASQHGTVSQTVNETVITVEYDRPVARGRELFGELVVWDAIWTPGANRATTIEFSTDVTLEGQALAAGKYGMWTIPRENGRWDVKLVSQWDTHHGMFPFGDEVLEVTVETQTGAHMEALAFYFPVVGPYEATLRAHWGNTILPLRIEVGQ